MNIIDYIQNHYGVLPEYLWQDAPNICIFRHQQNRKWFAVLMNDIPAAKLGLKENKSLNLINLKCDPELAKMILIDHKNIFPAYHMNKKHWISVVLENCKMEELKNLLAHSFRLTQKRSGSLKNR
ncbi:MAG: MmcQ/YjbR family DNA-binding protein [Neisseriaceae bacterium]|nr:MmcQ/YjbR family DNA-binding protein [Neisseriaceae bacterium]